MTEPSSVPLASASTVGRTDPPASPHRRLLRIVSSSSVLLAAVYVLGFIYLKGYLAAFGFQVELASLSIPNLVLVHRFFVGHHFFVGAGAADGFLFARFGRAGVRRHWIAALIIVFFPVLLLPIDHQISVFSEKGTPAGLNIGAPGLVPVFALGWGRIDAIVRARELRVEPAVQPLPVGALNRRGELVQPRRIVAAHARRGALR